jgi:hypothetical protein
LGVLQPYLLFGHDFPDILTETDGSGVRFIFGGMEKNSRPADLALFAEAWRCLLRARWILLFRPFNKILPLLEDNPAMNKRPDNQLLERIQLSIMRASKKSPWRTRCFEQALAARMMLKRRGIATTTYFGVLKNENDKIEAHAWLKCGAFVVTGWQRMNEYKIVGTFS